MEKVKVLLVGVGGYGSAVYKYIKNHVDKSTYEIVGVVDPYAAKAACFEDIKEQGYKLFDTVEEFYAENSAELAVICTPIPLHKPQSIYCMEHGTHVLCEKPLVPVMQDLHEMKAAAARTGKILGVGFQWSFCKPMLDLKKDIMSGVFGKPIALKVYISWQRFDEYYDSWKGNARGKNGEWILDCIATNATAHYLHNICFMMGDKLNASKMPVECKAMAYRAKDIETYDTCFVKGKFDNGADFYYIATHSGDIPQNPTLTYTFEKAVVTMTPDGEMNAYFNDGHSVYYGNPQKDESISHKITAMIKAVRGEDTNTCPPDAVIPHLAITNAIFEQIDIAGFPKETIFRSENPAGTFVKGLSEDCTRCYNEFKLPSELGLKFAVPEAELTLSPDAEFKGLKF